MPGRPNACSARLQSPSVGRYAGRLSAVGFATGLLAAACSAPEAGGTGSRGGGNGTAGDSAAAGGGGGAAPNDAGAQAGSGGAQGPVVILPVSGSSSQPLSDAGAENCAAVSQRAMNQRMPADIIIAVDNSGSMDDEIGFVRDNLNAFSQRIVDSGIDVHIILVSAAAGERNRDLDIDIDEDTGICVAPPLGSGACPLDSMPPRYTHIAREVGSNDALDMFIATFPEWSAQLRPNASKTFVVVSDDNADRGPNNSAAGFEASVAALPGGLFERWSFSGIYCFSDCPDSAEIGQVYADLVMSKMGVAGDLCLQDFKPVFDRLAEAVVEGAGLDCEWPIPEAPVGQTFDRDKVNVRYTSMAAATDLQQFPSAADCGMREGWYYDDANAPTRILACPQSCSALQVQTEASVEVLFGCETMVAPQ
jgi:hypothetical protein